jgi:ATP-dependent RNA helicase RhlE
MRGDLSQASSFESLGLSEPTLRSLKAAHFQQPTPIQAQAIPHALEGKDVIGCAATGTGKTAAFVLPMVERLARPGPAAVRGLVLAPTRELALQIAEQLDLFGGGQKIRGAVIIGGVSMGPQIDALRRKPAIIIATPGRLVDHLQQRTIDLSGIEMLVLDEADRMLDMGFKPQLTRILARLPKKRQTLLFSATMAGEVAEFARSNLSNPAKVEVQRSGTTASRAEQALYLVSQNDKAPLLLALLESGDETTLVFTRTKRRADKIARVVERAGHNTARIHADRSQAQRRQALEGFKSGRYRVLVATDIAARGIDVEEIGHVVNFDLPHVPEDYVHRIGRTARHTASGKASSFAAPEEVSLLKDIERFTRALLPRKPLPTESPAFLKERERMKTTQADPGEPQAGFRKSGRPAGQAPGRHARSHPKRHQSGESRSAGGERSGGGGEQRRQGTGSSRAAQGTPKSGTWGPPKRRR